VKKRFSISIKKNYFFVSFTIDACRELLRWFKKKGGYKTPSYYHTQAAAAAAAAVSSFLFCY